MMIPPNSRETIAQCGRHIVPTPHPSDIVSGTLRQAFATSTDDSDLVALLARIDRVDLASDVRRRDPG